MLHPAVPEAVRGTFVGLGAGPVVDYIKSLGVTSVELMPIQTFINDNQLLERGLTNHWGYNSVGFFAPDPRYASDRANTLREFKEMVARFHDAGLEVILDVVYNHTAEATSWGRRSRSKASTTRAITGCFYDAAAVAPSLETLVS